MDVLRAALGESTMTYFGASYGTKLGATYADLFPDKVGRMVLDGAVDLSIDSRELSLEQAAGFETALRAYVAGLHRPGLLLPRGRRSPRGSTGSRPSSTEIDASPLPTTSATAQLEVGNAFYGIVAPLYNRDYWFILSPGPAGRARRRRLDPAAALRPLHLAGRLAARTPTTAPRRSTRSTASTTPTRSRPSEVADNIPAFEEASPTFGRVFAWGLTGCAGFPEDAATEPRDIRAAGAAPIVVVGTSRDPATPYLWAVHLAEQLESGVLVSRDGDGHTGYNAGNACVDQAIEAYLVRGKVPQDGLSC